MFTGRLHKCDGLFLTAVSNLGVRFPVKRLIEAVEAASHLWFVVVDGAQDYCHLPPDPIEGAGNYDLYLTGTHKWMGAYLPMGLAFYGRKRSQAFIETALAQMTVTGELDDPLVRFSKDGGKSNLRSANETISLAPLFACHGAALDAASADATPRLANVTATAEIAQQSGWNPLLPAADFRSGILLLQADNPALRHYEPATLRAAFVACGIALTCPLPRSDRILDGRLPNCHPRGG